jgi:guanylate kinase
VIEKRLNNAKKEIQKGQELAFYQHLINDDLPRCLSELSATIDQRYSIQIKK